MLIRRKRSYENLRNITRQRSATFFQADEKFNENKNEVKKQLKELIYQLIIDNKVELFYFTGETEIDRLAHEIVTEIRPRAPHIKRVYVSTRKWDDTYCYWDRTKINKYFEQRVRVAHADFLDKKYHHLNFQLQLIDWCTYIVYYKKLDRLENFFHLNDKFSKEDKIFRKIIKTCPRKLIKLVDYELENLILFKNRNKLRPIKRPDLKAKIRAMRSPKPFLNRTMIVHKEKIKLVERQADIKRKPFSKKAKRVRKKPFNRKKVMRHAYALERQRLEDIGKRYDEQVARKKPIVEDFIKNKPKYIEQYKQSELLRKQTYEKTICVAFDKQIKVNRPKHDKLAKDYAEYKKLKFEEYKKRQLQIGKKFDKQVRAYRKAQKQKIENK